MKPHRQTQHGQRAQAVPVLDCTRIQQGLRVTATAPGPRTIGGAPPKAPEGPVGVNTGEPRLRASMASRSATELDTAGTGAGQPNGELRSAG